MGPIQENCNNGLLLLLFFLPKKFEFKLQLLMALKVSEVMTKTVWPLARVKRSELG